MAFDERLAQRARKILGRRKNVTEQKMFGGLAFMVNGHMCCGITNKDFMVRVGPKDYGDALKQEHARPMDFTGRPLTGIVYVDPKGLETPRALKQWIDRGVGFVHTLPAK